MYTPEQLAPHIDEIKQALGNKMSEAAIGQELQKYLQLRVPLAEAKRGIVQKFGGDPLGIADAAKKKLAQVDTSDRYLELMVKIVSVNPRTITMKGEERVIFYGLMADDTMTRPFTAWEDLKLVKGEVYEILGAYTKEWRGDPEIQLGNRTRVRKLEAAPDFEVSYSRTLEGTEYKLNELRGGTFNIIVVGKILDIESRVVNARGESKNVISGTIADMTARVGFTAWHDFGLAVGTFVRISGAYVKEWRGIPQITFDSRAQVTVLDASDPAVAELAGLSAEEPQFFTIEALSTSTGAMDVAVEGVVLELREGTGLIFRCPLCKRKLREGECMVHGMQDGQPDLRVKAVFDDGTGAIVMVINRELTEPLIGMTLDECLAGQEGSADDPCHTALENALLAKPYVVRGNIVCDEFGPMLVARSLAPVELDIQTRAEALAQELEGWP